VIFVAKLEMVLVESGFSNIKDTKIPILASGLPDTTKLFLTNFFTWHAELVSP
jgi:hypothetical protein